MKPFKLIILLLSLVMIWAMVGKFLCKMNPIVLTSDMIKHYTTTNPIVFSHFDGTVTFSNIEIDTSDEQHNQIYVTFDYTLHHIQNRIQTTNKVKAIAQTQFNYGKLYIHSLTPYDIQFTEPMRDYITILPMFAASFKYLNSYPIYELEGFGGFMMKGHYIESDGIHIEFL